MHYRVHLSAEHIDGRHFQYRQDFESECALRIGSHPECDLQLDGRDVASFHLSVVLERLAIRMVDLGSPAGAWQGTTRLTSTLSKREAQCRMGPYTIDVSVESAGLGEAEESPGDLEVAQWHGGQICRVWYAERRDGADSMHMDGVTITSSVDGDSWRVGLASEDECSDISVGFETVYTTVGPYLWSCRQVSVWRPETLPKRTPPHPWWLGTLGFSIAAHATFVLALVLTPTPVKETSLVALEQENRFAKLFLDDIKKSPPPPRRVEKKPPLPPPKPKVTPKPPQRIEEDPETVVVRKKRRLKRKRREKGLAEAMASLGGGSAQERALLDGLHGSAGSADDDLGSGNADGVVGFDDWLASMKLEEVDDETKRRQYQGRIEGQIAARKGDLRRCLEASLLKRRGEVRVEVAWSIRPDGRLSDVRVTTGLLKLPKLRRCLVKELKSWRLTPPPLGKPVELSFPVVFRET